MAEPEYEYYGLMAESWDLFRGDTSAWEDRAFFLELIHRSGEPVLDVGCGTGRLLLDYMSQGVDIDGVDISPEMLGICQEKAHVLGLKPRLFQNDMARMELPRQYRTIIVPSSSFQLVINAEQAQATVQNFYAHLLPGGTLAMPFMSLQGEDRAGSWQKTGEMVRPGDGALVRRWSTTQYDPQTQLEHTQDRYEVFKNGEKIGEESHVRSPATRTYTQQQAVDLYTAAGFKGIHIYSGFTFQTASEADELFTITGQKG